MLQALLSEPRWFTARVTIILPTSAGQPDFPFINHGTEPMAMVPPIIGAWEPTESAAGDMARTAPLAAPPGIIRIRDSTATPRRWPDPTVAGRLRRVTIHAAGRRTRPGRVMDRMDHGARPPPRAAINGRKPVT